MKFSISLRYPFFVGSVLVASSIVFCGCNKGSTETAGVPVGTPAPVSNAALQQQVQNDPNMSPEKKQQIADALQRQQAADNDQRALQRRPAPTSP